MPRKLCAVKTENPVEEEEKVITMMTENIACTHDSGMMDRSPSVRRSRRARKTIQSEDYVFEGIPDFHHPKTEAGEPKPPDLTAPQIAGQKNTSVRKPRKNSKLSDNLWDTDKDKPNEESKSVIISSLALVPYRSSNNAVIVPGTDTSDSCIPSKSVLIQSSADYVESVLSNIKSGDVVEAVKDENAEHEPDMEGVANRDHLEDMDVSNQEGSNQKQNHVSIQRRAEDLVVRRCKSSDCCRQQFHCPLCPQEQFAPRQAAAIKVHIRQTHFGRGVEDNGWTMMKCNLPCSSEMGSRVGKAHWHCPMCSQLKLHRSRLRDHLANHRRGRVRAKHRPRQPRIQETQPTSVAVDPSTIDSGSKIGSLIDLNSVPTESVIMVSADLGDATEKVLDVTECSDLPEPLEAELPVESIKQEVQELDTAVESINERAPSSPPQVDESQGAEQLSDNLLDTEKIPSALVSVDNQAQASEIFQTVAALVGSDRLGQIPGDRDIFLDFLRSHTGVSVTTQDSGSVLFQGTWSQLCEVHSKIQIACEWGQKGMITSQDWACMFRDHEDAEDAMGRQTKEWSDEGSATDGADVSITLSQEINENKVELPTDSPGLLSNSSEQPVSEADISEGDEEGDDNTLDIGHEEHCPFCQRLFRYRSSLFTHLANIHLRESSRVKDAKKLDPKWRLIIRRMISVKKPQCPECSKKFKALTDAKVHFALKRCLKVKTSNGKELTYGRNPETGKWECNLCSYSCKHMSVVKQHFERCHLVKTMPCPKCNKKFGTKAILKLHLRCVHETVVSCPECFDTMTKDSLQLHLKERHPGSKTRQSVAPKTFPWSSRKQYLQPKACTQCDKYQTTNPAFLKRHIRDVHGPKNFVCHLCGMQFARSVNHKSHMKIVHPSTQDPDRDSPWDVCHLCGKKMLKRNIRAHIRHKHQGVRAFQCPTCEKKFQTKYVLDCHLQTHMRADERKYPYTCSHCGSGFSNKTIYSDHLNIHTNERPYKCDKCGNTFRQKTVWQKHLETHSKQQFVCPLCQKLCPSRHIFTKHIASHNISNGEHPDLYVCSCGLQFESVKQLYQHAQSNSCKSLENFAYQYANNVSPVILESTQQGETGDMETSDLSHSMVQALETAPDSPKHETSVLEGGDIIIIGEQGNDTEEKHHILVPVENLGNNIDLDKILALQTSEDINVKCEKDPDTLDQGYSPETSQSNTEGGASFVITGTSSSHDALMVQNSTETTQPQIMLLDYPGCPSETAEVSSQDVPTHTAVTGLRTPRTEGVPETSQSVQLLDADLNVSKGGARADCNEEQKFFLCGQCQLVFRDINSVQKHLLSDHLESGNK